MRPLEEGQGPLGPLLPHDLTEFVVGIVLFLIVFAVMYKVVVPMFERTYATRRDAIEGGMERAERAEAEAKAALVQYQEKLATAQDEAAAIREGARAEGAQIIAESRSQAQAESARIVTQAHAQIEADRQQAIHSLQGEVGGLATSLAGKIVGESLTDDERARRTVDRFLAELEAEHA